MVRHTLKRSKGLRNEKKSFEKPATDTKTVSKITAVKREISFVENSGIKELHLGKKKLHLNKTSRSFLTKCLINYNKKLAGTDSLNDLATVEKFISNTLNEQSPMQDLRRPP